MESEGRPMRVVLVEDEQIIRLDLRQMLTMAGLDVVGEGADGIDAVNLCREFEPDVVLLDIKMPNLDGISAAKQIVVDGSCGAIVFLTAFYEEELVSDAIDIGAFGYLVKPIDEKSLLSTIQIAYAKAQANTDLETRLSEIEKRLEDRKVIEKAKGLLMRRGGIDEEEAYTKLRMLSMEKRSSMRTIADLLLAGADENGHVKR